jgi:hypothetical protein
MRRLLLLLTFGAWPAAAFQDAVICVLFDLSQSAQDVRAGYQADFNKLVDGLAGGELVLGAGITANSLATGRFEIEQEMPKYSPFADSKLTFGKKLLSARTAMKQASRRLLEAPATMDTDLLGGMELAEKAFGSTAAISAKVRSLVLFSDMVEESSRYNFRKEPVTSARVTAILEAERRGERLPSLKGVQVLGCRGGRGYAREVSPDPGFLGSVFSCGGG